jgi:hypothetical protein
MTKRCLAILMFVLLSAKLSGQTSVVTAMTPDAIQQAIDYGQRVDRAGYGTYVLKVNGYVIGAFTTPFGRVLEASFDAKRRYTHFTVNDVPPDILALELHIYAPSSLNEPVGGRMMTERISNVDTIVITTADRTVIQPLRVDQIPLNYKNVMGWNDTGRSLMAVFPLSALADTNVAHIIFDSIINPRGGLLKFAQCTDCLATLPTKLVR